MKLLSLLVTVVFILFSGCSEEQEQKSATAPSAPAVTAQEKPAVTPSPSAVTTQKKPAESPAETIPVYEIGKELPFTADHNPAQFLKQGWSGQEKEHRWTDGPQAGMAFRIQPTQGKDLVLRFEAGGYLGGGLSHQTIGVKINNQQVTTWEMTTTKLYEARIPAQLFADGILELQFTISKPTAPCEVSESKDCRKLGIAARKLVMNFAD
jgi:hypothetical protein